MRRRTFLQHTGWIMAASKSPAIPLFKQETMQSTSEIHKFKIGDFTCTLFKDLMFAYQSQHYFSNVEASESAAALEKFNQIPEKIPSPFVTLLLEKEDNKILVDSGMGFMEDPVMFHGNSIQFQGKTKSLLEANGTSTEDLTHVIITHFHPDHIGGICESNGQLIYPNAQIISHRDEFDFWRSPRADAQQPLFQYFIDQNIKPLTSKNLLFITREEESIIDGIDVIKIPGHTPGQLAVRIESLDKRLLFVSDAWLHPLHIQHLDWQTSYDLDHDLAKKSKLHLLEIAHQENMLVQSFHFEFPGLGRIDKLNNNWKWVPEKI